MVPTSAYLDPYRDFQKRHGNDFGVTLWANRRSQLRRFEIFDAMAPLAGKRVLDAGCSRGDFAAFLIEREVRFDQYIGVDALCEVVDYARGRGLPRCTFHCGDMIADPGVMRIGRPQIICISGTLNTMDDASITRALEHAWAGASEILMFNFLSDQVGPKAPPQLDPARRLSTMAMLKWAFEKTSDIAFRQDYFPQGHDATIVMRK